MSPLLVLTVIVIYFAVLFLISRITSRKVNVDTYFTGNRQSPWFVVAFGMIGASLSGITFISVPGEVGNTHLYYFQLVLGYLVGYFVIATVLLPLYYRLKLVSIYSYLETRFGNVSHKTGSLFFLLSQSIGASLRLFVVAGVLHLALFQYYHIPFMLTVCLTVLLIWAYTYKAGIKTIVWTDTFQTFMMLLSVGLSIFIVTRDMNLSFGEMTKTVIHSEYSTIFNWDWKFEKNFYKQFVTGIVVAIAMNGLDQNEMQKSLTCKSLKEAQKNIYLYSIILVVTNLIFLSLGVLLYTYVQMTGMVLPVDQAGNILNTDNLFPDLALNQLGTTAGIVFMLGIASAAFSSADSALTSLTTAFYTDFLHLDHKTDAEKLRIRMRINIAFALILITIIMIFRAVNNDSVINTVYTIAGYTYGPLLGLYAFGLFTRHKIRDKWVPLVVLLSPVLAWLLNLLLIKCFGFYLGYTLLLFNGLITFAGLTLIRTKGQESFSVNP
ncbi:MAG: sodium:solute symporter [Bacteroidia bacterium]|nr:MAG: sodium:solute symporter [Bacteroidia bacterium]